MRPCFCGKDESAVVTFTRYAYHLLSMKKHLSVVLSLSFLLVSCGGSTTTATCTRQYWDGLVGTCLPADWAVIEREALSERGISEDVVVAFKREKAVNGQFPTVTVTQEALSAPVDPASYSAASVQSVSVLPGYNLIDQETLAIDGADITLHIFTAQPSQDEPERRFYQLSTTMANFGYSVTGLTPLSPSRDIENEVKQIMSTVTFQAPLPEHGDTEEQQ